MLVRSRRGADAVKPTPDVVGPGTYNAPSYVGKTTTFGRAPFGSTACRDGEAVADGPGPGSYSNEQPVADRHKGQSAFASRVPRIAKDNTDGPPGPGSYSSGLVLPSMARSHSFGAPRRNGGATDGGINWVKVETAPSIPVNSQTRGYLKDTGTGALVQSATGTTIGRNGTDVGPGNYNPSLACVKPSCRTSEFCRSDRNTVTASAPNPGPGTYDSSPVGRPSARQTSCFASESKRAPAAKKSVGPGPGSFTPPSQFQSLPEYLSYNPESFHSFGRTHDTQSAPADEKDSVPGPGLYTPMAPARKAPVSAASVFSSNTCRFGHAFTGGGDAPGPGTYSSESLTLDAALRAKMRGRFGAFGATAPRFTKGNVSTVDEAKAAALAEREAARGRHVVRRRPVPTSAFQMGTRQSKSADSTPGPGTYSHKAPDWRTPASLAGVFHSGAPRWATDTSDGDPGPGAYHQPGGAPGSKNHGARFAMGSRFPPPVVNEAPGPGTYEASSALVKKTFNITIGG